MFIERLIEKKFLYLQKIFSAVYVFGPKFSGKSELCKKFSKTVIDLMDTFENTNNRTILKNQPDQIFSMAKPILFDE
jgi:predicted AAA+ superfamily ATPase